MAQIDGGPDGEVLTGTAGDDTIAGGDGTDSISGGEGLDVHSAAGGTEGVWNAVAVPVFADGFGNFERVDAIEGLEGTAFADTLSGDVGANVLLGGDGDDRLSGGGGQDTLRGGAGDDTLIGGAPVSTLVKPQDRVIAIPQTAPSLDPLFSLAPDAAIRDAATVPHATVYATASGDVELYAFTAAAGATATFDIDRVRDDPANPAGLPDTVLRLLDTDGTTLLLRGDDIEEDAGDGVTGPGTLEDRLDPGTINPLDTRMTFTFDTAGTYFVEVIGLSERNDDTELVSGTFYVLHVSLTGAPVADPGPLRANGSRLEGGTGDDLLQSGDAFDEMAGGAGDDTYLVNGAGDVVIEAAGEGTDTVLFATADTRAEMADFAHVEALVLLDGAFGEAEGGAGDDDLTGNAAGNVLTGAGGDDRLSGGAGRDSADGGSGDDHLTGDGWADVLLGGAGADSLHGGGGADRVEGGEGADLLTGGAWADLLSGGADADTLFGGDGRDSLAGEGGDDLLSGGARADLLEGGTGADTLIGGRGADSLDGGAGDDLIDGGAQADRLSGGAGADVFLFRFGHGRDEIADFDPAEDVLRFVSLNPEATGPGDLLVRGEEAGGAWVLDPGGQGRDVVILLGVRESDLTAANFDIG